MGERAEKQDVWMEGSTGSQLRLMTEGITQKIIRPPGPPRSSSSQALLYLLSLEAASELVSTLVMCLLNI